MKSGINIHAIRLLMAVTCSCIGLATCQAQGGPLRRFEILADKASYLITNFSLNDANIMETTIPFPDTSKPITDQKVPYKVAFERLAKDMDTCIDRYLSTKRYNHELAYAMLDFRSAFYKLTTSQINDDPARGNLDKFFYTNYHMALIAYRRAYHQFLRYGGKDPFGQEILIGIKSDETESGTGTLHLPANRRMEFLKQVGEHKVERFLGFIHWKRTYADRITMLEGKRYSSDDYKKLRKRCRYKLRNQYEEVYRKSMNELNS